MNFPAFQAVVLVGEIKPGDDVMVHAGASGVGVAAIQLSHAYQAYVSRFQRAYCLDHIAHARPGTKSHCIL